MKNLTVLSFVVVGLFIACNNSTPQEKAESEMEKYEEKAYDAAKDANSTAIDATEKSVESMIYTNIASANQAVSQIPMPTLSNAKAKELCADLGKSIVDRINAADASKAADVEKSILKEKAEVEKALIDKKITQEDRDSILKYVDDCFSAAKNAV